MLFQETEEETKLLSKEGRTFDIKELSPYNKKSLED